MQKDLSKLFQEKKEEYKGWKPVYCPALEAQVSFTMHGFNHLKFRTGNVTRSPKELRQRLLLLVHVRSVLRNAHTAISYRKRLHSRGKRTHAKETEYWAVEANLGNGLDRIRIVLTKTEGMKNIQFLSVIKKK